MWFSQEQILCVLCLFFSFYKIEIQLIDNVSGIWQSDTVIHIAQKCKHVTFLTKSPGNSFVI